MDNMNLNEPKPTQPHQAGLKISAVIPSSQKQSRGVFTDEYIRSAEKAYGAIPMSAREISKDTERALNKLYKTYSRGLPHNPLSASKVLQDEAARVDADRQLDSEAYDEKIREALNREAEKKPNSQESDNKSNARMEELRELSKRGPLSDKDAKEYEDLLAQQGQGGGMGMNLFQSLAKRLGPGGGDQTKAVTNQVIQNNARLRHIANDMENASTLASITQNNLRQHLATLDFDVEKGINDLSSNRVDSHEAQAILQDPTTSDLMQANDAAQANLLSKMAPNKLREVQEISESGMVNRKLEGRVEKALEQASEAVDSNEKLPSKNGMMKQVMDSIKNFIAAIQNMLNIGSSADKGMSR